MIIGKSSRQLMMAARAAGVFNDTSSPVSWDCSRQWWWLEPAVCTFARTSCTGAGCRHMCSGGDDQGQHQGQRPTSGSQVAAATLVVSVYLHDYRE